MTRLHLPDRVLLRCLELSDAGHTRPEIAEIVEVETKLPMTKGRVVGLLHRIAKEDAAVLDHCPDAHNGEKWKLDGLKKQESRK